MEILHIFWSKFLYCSRYLGNLKHLGHQKLTPTLLLIEVQKFRSKTWKTHFCTKYPRTHTEPFSCRGFSPPRAFSPFCCYVMPAARNQPIPYPKLSKPGHTHTTRHFVKPAGRWPVALAQVTQGGCGISLHPWRCSWDVLGSQLCTALPEHRVAPDDFQRSLPASALLWFSCTHRSVKMPGTWDLIKCVWLFFFPQRLKKEQFLQLF